MSAPEREALCQARYVVVVTTTPHQRLVPREVPEGQTQVGEYDVFEIPAREIGVTVFCTLPAGHDDPQHEARMPPPDLVTWISP